MCGIAGYIGKQQAAPIILDGLSKLEYRGYDSARGLLFLMVKKSIWKKQSADFAFWMKK